MPTVRVIAPAGGGDYTRLDDWWAWARTQSSADQWAEIRGGEVQGDIDFSTATFTPDATHYVRIYGGPGATHQGVYDSSKARLHNALNVNLNYTRIENLICESFSDGPSNITIQNCHDILINAVYFYHRGGSH